MNARRSRHGAPADRSGFDQPLMREAFPLATSRVAEILVELGESRLAERLLDQRFYGRCDCRPDCQFVLTAPAGSSGPYMLWLEVAGEIVGEVSLDPDGTFVTNFVITDCPAAGIPPNWLESTSPVARPGRGRSQAPTADPQRPKLP